jgi:hypothetical protein
LNTNYEGMSRTAVAGIIRLLATFTKLGNVHDGDRLDHPHVGNEGIRSLAATS